MRLVVIALMLGSLVMAVSVPEAFGDQALLFAGAYVAIQVGRTAFLAFAASHAGHRGARAREPHPRLVRGRGRVLDRGRARRRPAAHAAVAGGPGHRLRRPRGDLLGAVGPAHRAGDWDVGTAHFAERFQLFVIIALGESIVITGATTAELDLDVQRVVALSLAFLSTAAMWWLYFDYVARIAERRLELAENRTELARDAYTYLHVLMIAGVIVAAVGDELVIAHPPGHLTRRRGGRGGGRARPLPGRPRAVPAAHDRHGQRARPAGTLACVALGLVGTQLPALVLGALLLAVLVGGDRVGAGQRARAGARGASPRRSSDWSWPIRVNRGRVSG